MLNLMDNKRDHRDNNQTGTQGPPGPAGPQGIQGIQGPIGLNGTQGPAGPSQILSTIIYTVPGNISNTNATGVANSVASCNPGDAVLSGSYILSSPADTLVVRDNALPTQDGWQTSGAGDSAEIFRFRHLLNVSITLNFFYFIPNNSYLL
jgi:hypothetical protein